MMQNEYIDRLRDEPRPVSPENFTHKEREVLQLFRDLIRDAALAIAVELNRIANGSATGRRQAPKMKLAGKGTVNCGRG